MAKSEQEAKRIAAALRFDWSKAAPQDDLTEVATAAAEDALGRFKVSVVASDVFHSVNAAAVNWARQHAGELITQVSDSTREFVRAQVAQGLEEGWSTAQLKREILDGYTFSNDRALMISRTESATAANQGGLIAARGAGMATKTWLPVSDACEEICLPNADDGAIDIGEDFDSGDDAPPAHPNCRCSLSYGSADEETDAESTDEEEI